MPTPTPQNAHSQLRCDWQGWLDHVQHVDASDEEKCKLIEIVWSIMVTFVDLSWDGTPQKQTATQKTCGKPLELAAALRSAVLKSKDKEET
jgi:hypothetical protein